VRLREFGLARYLGREREHPVLPEARSTSAQHRFGGAHTDDKLARLRAYLQQFAIALKDQGFSLIYIDAFAGSDARTNVLPVLPLLDGDGQAPQTVSVSGSARLAIEINPPFDRLVLIEKNRRRHAALERLCAEFPKRLIECHQRDANHVVQNLCRTASWRGANPMRGVIFLDPFGMEVDWTTVREVAATKALDLWYYFPLMGLYRQAANRLPSIDSNKRSRLNRVLGTDDWEGEWYDTPHGPTDLFDDPQTVVRTADVDAIEHYVKSRLKSVFEGTVLDPLRIYNERNAPTASLFFAVSNPSRKAVRLATNIARHILARPLDRSRLGPVF
jgi:three-Cys-motif partner protein